MPVRTVRCSKCGARISGYDYPERMAKLRRHYKKYHPIKFKKMIEKAQGAKRKNPYPLLIANLANPDSQSVVTKYLKKYPHLKSDLKREIELFTRIHGKNAKIKPVVINDAESKPHIEVTHGIIKETVYDTGIIKGSKLADAIYFHPAGDKKFSKVNRPGIGTLSNGGKVHRIRYNRSIMNPEGMMDG